MCICSLQNNCSDVKDTVGSFLYLNSYLEQKFRFMDSLNFSCLLIYEIYCAAQLHKLKAFLLKEWHASGKLFWRKNQITLHYKYGSKSISNLVLALFLSLRWKKKKKKKLVRLVKATLKCAYKAKFEISHSVIRQSSGSARYRLPSQFSDGDRNHSVCFTECLLIRSHIGDMPTSW